MELASARAEGDSVSVLIVGAGPTGLALATQLRLFATPFRIIDRAMDRTRESRALAVQARTLEVLDAVGLGDALVALGRTSTRLVFHSGARALAEAKLGEIGATDTRFPFILFVSQAETERLLDEHLARSGVRIERGVELEHFAIDDDRVDCVLRHPDGREERVRTLHLVGCDGAHSTVRKLAGFSFTGGTYPQDFVLGDVEADGPLAPEAINSFVGGGGVAMFFPLGTPRTWRVIAMRAADSQQRRRARQAPDDSPVGALTLEELQAIVVPPTEGSVTVRDPAWLAHFRLHHRQIAHYRTGPVFLAGDAAHIHSPVGAQGMNTGVQDAWNLGWKLALVTRGAAHRRLLDSYAAERWPVGQFLLRYTDRVFTTFTRAMSGGRLATWARGVVGAHVIPLVLGRRWLRRAAFRFVSELGIRYRESFAVTEGRPRLRTGPRAGDRLPDARVTLEGQETWLHRAVIGPHLALVLCARHDARARSIAAIERLAHRYAGLVVIRVLSTTPSRGALVDADGDLLDRLGVNDVAQYLVRPDGYIAFRCGGWDVAALEAYLGQWLSPARTEMREVQRGLTT